MGKLTCNCLNVQISTKLTDVHAINTSNLGVNPVSTDEFFSSKISEIQLSLEGVKFEQPYLVKPRQVGEWCVHRCMSCKLSTHATHTLQGSGKVLINMEMQHDNTEIEALAKSPDFSPLYRIVLPGRNDNQPVRALGVQSEKYESLQKTLGEIQHQLNHFLVREETAMEERIKVFMDTQRKAYADLQSKVRRDKNTMVNLVLASEQHEISESLSDAMTESPTSPISPGQNISSEEITSEPELPVVTKSSNQSKRTSGLSSGLEGAPALKTKNIPSLSERLKMKSRFSAALQENKVTSTVDADGDLDFDSAFQDESSPPFYNSDDETEDTDDSEPEIRGRHNNKNNMYSTSVPISVPMWGARPTKPSYIEDDLEEEGSLPHDGASMAASIKALAQSVHGDGTEMFGELPRPRLNTSNFVLP